MSITDADDLDMNLSEPVDDGTSLTDHADLEAALASDAEETNTADLNDDILSSIDDDPLDLSLGGDADESELEAAFGSDSAIDATPDLDTKAPIDALIEEKGDDWEDAPENLTGNFTDLAQQAGLDLPESELNSEVTPTLTSEIETPQDTAAEDPEDSEFLSGSDEDQPLVMTASDPILKRIVAVMAFLLLGGGAAFTILFMGSSDRIAVLEQQLTNQSQPMPSVSTDNGLIEQRMNDLQGQLDQITQQPTTNTQNIAEFGQFNDKINQLQTAFEQLNQTIQEMQREKDRPPAAQPSAQPQAPAKAVKGEWHVNIMSFSREQNARKMQQDLTRKGLDTEINASSVNGKTWYRLGISGQANRTEALALRDRLQSEMGLANVWIGRD